MPFLQLENLAFLKQTIAKFGFIIIIFRNLATLSLVDVTTIPFRHLRQNINVWKKMLSNNELFSTVTKVLHFILRPSSHTTFSFLFYFFGVTCPFWLSLLFFILFCHQVVRIFHLVFRQTRKLNSLPRTMAKTVSPQHSQLDQGASNACGKNSIALWFFSLCYVLALKQSFVGETGANGT